MKNRKRMLRWGCIGLMCIWQQAHGSLSFHAPYDTSLDLTTGVVPQPVLTNGTVPLVGGFSVQGMPGNAASFTDSTNGVGYGQANNYFAGIADSTAVGANTFRLLFKPNFAGPSETQRHFLLGAGALTGGDTFSLFHSDDFRGPTFFIYPTGGGGYLWATGFSNFNWNSSAWYYMGVSFDSVGVNFYLRELTNGASAMIQSLSFSGAATWGSGGNVLANAPLQVGLRPSTLNENANGRIDDVKVWSGEKWSITDFHADYALNVPEPSVLALLTVAGAALLWRRKRTAE